jgi:hypothetical protein
MPDYRGGDAARRDTGGVYSDVEACTTHSLGQERDVDIRHEGLRREKFILL